MLLTVSSLALCSLMHAELPCALGSAGELVGRALKAGALTAVASPGGTTVNALLPEVVSVPEVEPVCVEPLWEPDDWDDAAISFKTAHIADTLIIRSLPDGSATAAATVQPKSSLCAVQLLEHPHAFLTTTAGQLHASTLMLLELLSTRYATDLDDATVLLDYGAGSGVLSLSALALSRDATAAGRRTGPPLRVYGVDVHDAALSAARRNSLLNACDACASYGYDWELPSKLLADVAVANMLTGPLVSVAPDLITRVRVGGLLLLSGFRESDVPAIRAAFEPFFTFSQRPAMESVDGWLALACRRVEGGELTTADLSERAIG
jgi:ribosomal protein L11 methylase PrmA